MHTNFDAAASFTFREEGGYSEDGRDPGNWSGGVVGVGVLIGSNFGVSAPELVVWSGRAATAEAMRGLSRDTALAIYAARYWQALRGDELPAGVDLSLVDMGYNAGACTSGRMLQKLLGLSQRDSDGWIGPQTLVRLQGAGTLVERWATGLGSDSARSLQKVLGIAADGVVGSQTLAALGRSPNRVTLALCCALAESQTLYYGRLRGFAIDGAGWLGRVGRRLEASLSLVRAISVLLVAIVIVSAAARAQSPPAMGAYEVNLGLGGPAQYAGSIVPMWIDTTNTTVNAWGSPAPISNVRPLPVQVIGGSGNSGSTVSTGNSSATAVPVQDAASGASVALASRQPVLNSDGGALAHVTNFPGTQLVSGTVSVSNLPTTQPVSAASLPLPAGAATAALQPALNADGGALMHISNFPTTQPVSGTVGVSNLPALPAGTNTIGSVSVSNLPATQAVSGTVGVSSLPALPTGSNAIGSVSVSNLPATQAVSGVVSVSSLPALPAGSNAIGSVTVGSVAQAARSGAWVDASTIVTTTAVSPAALSAAIARTGLHLWNLGANLVCLNYTTAAATSGAGCAAGSVPIPSGGAYFEDQPANVSPEAISLVSVGGSSAVTIKVR